MKLTNASEKALAVIAILATQEKGESVSSNIIINRLEISPSYTKKLLRKLVVANIIDSVSGNGGGFRLKRKLEDINLLEILEAIEGKISTYPDYGTLERTFSDFNETVESAQSIVKEIFLQADNKWKEQLSTYTVYDVLMTIFNNNITSVDWNNTK